MAGKTSADALRVDEVFCLASSLLENIGKVHFMPDGDSKVSIRLKTTVLKTKLVGIKRK